MKHLRFIILLFTIPLYFTHSMAQALSENDVKQKIKQITDSIDTYMPTGNDEKVLSICENGANFILHTDYYSTPVSCKLLLKAAESSLRLKHYQRANYWYYKAFVIDELGKCNVGVYSSVIKTAETDSNLVCFAKLLNLAKTDTVFFHDMAFAPSALGEQLNNIALNNFHKGDYTAALDFFELEQSLLDGTGDTGSDDYLSIFPLEIICLEGLEEYVVANSFAERYLEIVKYYRGSNTLTYAEALQSKADMEIAVNNTNTAIKLFTESLSLIESIVGKSNLAYIRCLLGLARAYQNRDGNHLKWLELALEAEKLLTRTPEAKPSDKAGICSQISSAYSISGDKNKSLEYAKKAVDALEESSNINNSDYAYSLYTLSSAYAAVNNYTKAIETAKKSIDIFSNIDRDVQQNIMYRQAISNLSWAYFKSGDTTNAISVIQTILTKDYADDKYKLSDLERLANYYSVADLKQELRTTCKTALELAEKLSGKDSQLYAGALSYFAIIQEKTGEKILMLQEAARIFEKLHLETSTDYLFIQQALTSLGFDIRENDDFANEQISYLEQLQSVYGDNSRKYYEESSLYLYRLGRTIYKKKESDKMIDVIQRAEQLLKEINNSFGDRDELYLNLQSQIAEMCVDAYRLRFDTIYYNRGIFYQSNVVAKSKLVYGSSNINYIRELETLARRKSERVHFQNYAEERANYREIDSIQQAVIEFYKNNFGKSHNYYVHAIETLASYYYSEISSSPLTFLWPFELTNPIVRDELYPKYLNAIELACEARDYYKSIGDSYYVAGISRWLSWIYSYSRQYDKAASCVKEGFENWKSYTLSQYSMYTSDEKSKLYSDFNWEIDTYSRNAYQNDSNAIFAQVAYDAQLFGKGLLLSSEIGLRELINESNDTKGRASLDKLQRIKAELTASATTDEDKQRLKTEYRAIERSLMKESQQYGDYMKSMSTTYADVKAYLKPKDVAIEFATTIPWVPRDSVAYRQYYALVLKRDYTSPKVVKICREDALSDPKKLYEAVWKPLADELQGVENVYFAPTMLLNNRPMESAVCPNGKLFSKTGLNLYRLSSTRELVRKHSDKSSKYHVAALYGGLQYDASVSQLIASDSKERTNGLRSATITGEDLSNDLRKSIVTWKYLAGTKQEVTEIDKIATSHGVNSKLYTDSLGTESTFKNLSKRGISLIHLATHGFFVKSNGSYQAEDEQLERSGLVLAGANNLKRGLKLPEGVDDGILTAAEISRLDFRGLDLVVLSACETGLGDLSSEGVYGLQRGFKKAGAGSIIMSLWPVSDHATQILMTTFYRNLFNGKSKHEALESAKDYVRTYNGGIYVDEKYWSGFILLDGIN